MKNFVWAIALSLVLIPSMLWADVTAKVVGPSEVVPGELVVLDATTTVGATKFKWKTLGNVSPKDYKVFEEGKVLVFSTSLVGEYNFILGAFGDSDGDILVHKLVVGLPVPPVPPTPPTPPVPPQPPIVVGKKVVILIRETSQVGPQQRDLVNGLRNGTQAAYLKEKGHTFVPLDKDSVGPDGKPSPTFQGWANYVKDLKLPAIVVYDPSNKTIVGKSSLDENATADTVIEFLKKFGG